MTRFPLWAAIMVTALSCNGEQAVDDTAPATGECVVDGDCAGHEICSTDLECESGDRDNSQDEAIDITLNAPVSGHLQTFDDQDWYRFTSPGDQWLRIQTVALNDGGEMDTFLEVFDENGSLHAFVDDFGTGGGVTCCDSLLHVYLPNAGAWYLRVTDLNGAGASSYAYELEVRDFNSTTIEADSVDQASRVVNIDGGNSIWTVGVNLEDPGDEDFIELDFDLDNTDLRVQALEGMPGSAAQVVVELLDPDQNTVSMKENLGVDGASAAYYLMSADSWILKTYDRLGNANAGDDYWYVLYFSSTEPDSYVWVTETEFNDSFGEAEPVQNQDRETTNGTPYEAGYVQGALDVEDDEDWFAIEVPAGHFFTAECYGDQVGALADLAIDLVDESEQIIETATDGEGGDTTPHSSSLLGLEAPAQTVYLRVYSEDDAVWGPGAFYRCNLFMTTFEPS